MGYYSRKKCRLSYFYNWLYLCILYQWNFLYWRLKDTTKILEKMLFWPLWWSGLTLTWRYDFSKAGLQNVGFWYLRFSRWSLAWVLSHLFPHLCILFLFFHSFLLYHLFSEKQRVSECQIFFFFFCIRVLVSLSIPEHYKFHLDFLYCAVYMIRQFFKKRRIRSSLLRWINVLVW